MRKAVFGALIAFISTLVSFEVLSVGYFLVLKGGFYYSHSESEKVDGLTGNVNATNDFNSRFGLPGLRVHPLLGWASASIAPGYNTEGFYSPVDYPYSAGDDAFVIGVFGESVAFNFWAWNARTGSVIADIKAKVPELADREIILLNFSKEGYRSPQIQNALSYFMLSGQRYDLVLHIAGHNEATGPWANLQQGVNPAFPTTSLITTFSELTSSNRVRRELISVYRGKYMRADAGSCTLASCWLVLETYGRILESAGTEKLSQTGGYDQSSNVIFVPTNTMAAPGTVDYSRYFQGF